MKKNGVDDDRDIDKEVLDLWNRFKTTANELLENTSQRIDRHVTEAVRYLKDHTASREDVEKVIKTTRVLEVRAEKLKNAQIRSAAALAATNKANLEDW